MPDIGEKLKILAGAAKYDASCASSGSGSSDGGAAGKGAVTSGAGNSGGFGVKVPAGVCHSWTGDGRCVSLLKVLYSNVCRFDCAYCVNRASAETERTSFTPDELVSLTTEFYRRNYIEGLFLSSGIFADPDIVMEKLTAVAKKLRSESGYNGYIHLKIIPGSGEDKIREAGRWADRLSANIELPTEKSLGALAPQKSGKVIFGAMNEIRQATVETEEDRRHSLKSAPNFAPAGQSTQLIVGASAEDDRTIIGLSGALYKKYDLRRVYYSAYTPVASLPAYPAIGGTAVNSGAVNSANDNGLPGFDGTVWDTSPGISPRRLLVREHRLYQADWLMRFYHFQPDEILNTGQPFLDSAVDPKTAWALQHLDRFPIEIKRAPYEELLRVPGVGARSARRIMEQRRSGSISFDGLRRLGVVLKRARYFITLGGAFLDTAANSNAENNNAAFNSTGLGNAAYTNTMSSAGLRRALDNPKRLRRILADEDDGLQLPLFDF
ncbi:MAG: putative DNA modification/repair radical SAM protein [Spirochaetaceae bacterium]|jgi:predicted DNA-binding helix-hairpin-helix protein|nr:putative DNA modification/repair radical SAM protein [Spirochaetaceae bacterium]